MTEIYRNNKDTAQKLAAHIKKLGQCRKCRGMYPPVVSGGAVVLVQAPHRNSGGS
ncbi:MAG: hypothetical protein NTX01_07215 [Candidatus Omnitrophica bacterium]|nr:hypothetical protein [Candidatus Omnitrophota bacterium]